MPLVSVLMGVYYRSAEIGPLERAVESILNQSLRDLELIICDDGSGEEAKEALDRFAEKDPRVLLLRPGGFFTLPQKLNLCLSSASGRLIARMDDDDVSHPQRLEKQAAYLMEHPSVAFVGCNIQRVSASGEKTIHRFLEFPKARDFTFSMPFLHPALLFRREALMAVNGYCEKSYCLLCEDYDLLMRLYSQGYCGANLQETLFDYSMAGVELRRRKYRYRVNEAVVRFQGFCRLKLLPGAFMYVLKPLAVGLMPLSWVNILRRKRDKNQNRRSSR